MDIQNDSEVNSNICEVCEGVNYYVRQKIFPCKNENCELYQERVSNWCNQCIRKIQRAQMSCPYCHQGQMQVNQFGQYRNPYLKKFTIGLLSTKYLSTKTTKFIDNPNYKPSTQTTQNEQENKFIPVPVGQFMILPVIPFNLISLTDQIQDKKGEGKMLLSHDRFVQALEVMTQDFQDPNKITQEDLSEITMTKNCLDILFNTCRHSMTRCGTNQIFVSGGYAKDIDFLYGIKKKDGKFVGFQNRLQDTWLNYQQGIFDTEQLMNGVYTILEDYKQIQVEKQLMAPENQMPFYYPYQNYTFFINFNQKDYSDFSVIPQSFLTQNRGFHQNVVTNNKIFVLGGICNGFVLDSIECADIIREVSSKITYISEFQQINSMTQPRANFSTVYKSAQKCTEENCASFKNKQKELPNCNNPNCHNHAYIYIAGGQSAYGKQQGELTIERYNFTTNECQTMSISYDEKSSIIKDFVGMTLGVWNNDLFIFGGVPKNEEVYKKQPTSLFVLLKPGTVQGMERIFRTEVISDQIQPCFLPQFTVSIPFQSQSEEEKSISENYRVFVVYHKQGEEFQFNNYRIAKRILNKNSNEYKITISKQIQQQNKKFQFVDKQWIQQGFQEEQSYLLLNSYIDY